MDRNTITVLQNLMKQIEARQDSAQQQFIDAVIPLVKAIQLIEARLRILELPLYERVYRHIRFFLTKG